MTVKPVSGIYILALKAGKVYVGFSDDIEVRIKRHFEGRGSQWTQKYPPIAVAGRFPGLEEEHEQLITQCLIAVMGVKNVRGGSYTARDPNYYPPITEENLANGYVKPPKAVKKRKYCVAWKKNGDPCTRSPLKGKRYCLFHRKQEKE
jgi:hypothetical protein